MSTDLNTELTTGPNSEPRPAPTNPTFAELGLPTSAADALRARGITEAFPIQAMSVPDALAGRDICGRAPTGSGKTIAFGLPLAHRVSRAKPKAPKALVLAPTRELAEQIRDELRQLLAPYGRSVASFYGGVGIKPQVNKLRRGVDVAVACPGRLGDLMNQGFISLAEVEIVVIDEADRMADMGFLPDVRRILDQIPANRQTLLFSATLDGDVDVLIKRYQNDPVRVEHAGGEDSRDRNTHHFIDIAKAERVGAAAELISEHGSTVVFCRTKHGTDRVARQLKSHGISAVPIHGGRSQGQRKRALASFSDGQAQALIATDVAARGIHVDNVDCVIHFDLAGDHKDYIHRSGRTGRAGAEGVVFTLVTEHDTAEARKLRRKLGVDDQGIRSNDAEAESNQGGNRQTGKSQGGHNRGGNKQGGKPKNRKPRTHKSGRNGQGNGNGNGNGQTKSGQGNGAGKSGQAKSGQGNSQGKSGQGKSAQNRNGRNTTGPKQRSHSANGRPGRRERVG